MIIFDFFDTIAFIICITTVIFLMAFSLMYTFKRKDFYKESKIKHRFAVLVPAYKDDEYIIPTVRSLMRQEYPLDCYEIIVIADHLHPDTILQLSQLPITLIQGNFKKSSKTKSLKAATKVLNENMYDIAVILNADNLTDTDFLDKINNIYSAGSTAIQTHRVRQERPTCLAVIDAVSDEIDNSIIRCGHVAAGLSSSLNGSGMAFDYSWFKTNINKIKDDEDEKALESLLLKERIFIDYLDDTYTYAIKVGNRNKFYNQQTYWIYAQYRSFFKNVKHLPNALLSGNFDYADRIIHWGILSKGLLIGIIVFFGIICIFIEWSLSIKWWILFIIVMFSMAMAIPDYLVDKKFNKAMKLSPFIGIKLLFKMIFNIK